MATGAGFDAAVARRLRRLAEERVMARVWDADTTLWKPDDDVHQRVAARSLGWLSVFRDVRPEVAALREFAAEVRGAGFRHAVLLGMGGSSLAPEVIAAVVGAAEGGLELMVVDTTDPRAIVAAEERLDLEASLFVVASKSGGTIETASLHAYFYDRLGGCCDDHGPGRHFIAVTDPETRLHHEAVAQGFRAVFLNPDDIGGRFSALSFFGLVPAALLGVDLDGLLDRAAAMAEVCGAETDAPENPALVLGAWMAEAVLAGRDKLTMVASRGVAAFGAWAEQLVAESTGKEGTGLFPVDGEPLGGPEAYGDDRAVVSLRLAGDADPDRDAGVVALEAAGVPVLRRELRDPLDLGGEFLLWELAVAVCGHVLGIDPFDQPDVQGAKDNTARVLARYAAAASDDAARAAVPDAGHAAAVAGADEAAAAVAFALGDDGLEPALDQLLDGLTPPAYVALHAWLPPGVEARRELEGLRVLLRDARGVATSAGFGPRFLHSTGQYHKGGPARGVFVQLVSEGGPDLPVPGRDYTFASLMRAQALGDLEALLARGGRVLRVDLGEDAVAGLRVFEEALRRVLAA